MAVVGGGGVISVENAHHCSVLFVCLLVWLLEVIGYCDRG